MKWAQTESFVSPFSLAQSGMPAADASLFAGVDAIDLAPPPAEALPLLRERLAGLFGVDPERLLVTPGASGAMHLLALHLFGPAAGARARMVSEVPSYEPFRALAELFGAELQVAQRRVEDGFELAPEAYAAKLRGAAPGHVFISNPHNPTGAVADAERIRALANAAEQTGGTLISNEIYMEFAQPEERFHAFALAPNAWSVGGLTKAYGLGALRIGWILAGEALADQIPVLEDLFFLESVSPATPSVRLALAALDRLPQLLAPLRRFETECRPHLVRWLEKEDLVTGPPPLLGLTAFPRLHGIDDTRAFARWLAREHQVDVVPGEFFGAPGHARIGFGVPEATLVEGLERLSHGLRLYGAAPA